MWPILHFFVLPHIKTIQTTVSSWYETFWHRLCLRRRIIVCECLCKIPTPHTGIRKENKCYSVNLESNPSFAAEVAWALICLVLPGDQINTAMAEIGFDLHGRHHLTMDDVCPSPPLHILSVPEVPPSPALQLFPRCLAEVGMATIQGMERAVIPRWKVG